MSRTGFALGDVPHVEVELFATETSTRLYAEFVISYSCPDTSEQARGNGLLELAGSGFFDSRTGAFLELRVREESITYCDADGEKTTRNHYVSGMAVVGHRTIERTLRVPLVRGDETDETSL